MRNVFSREENVHLQEDSGLIRYVPDDQPVNTCLANKGVDHLLRIQG